MADESPAEPRDHNHETDDAVICGHANAGGGEEKSQHHRAMRKALTPSLNHGGILGHMGG